jgi:hypothetical protein
MQTGDYFSTIINYLIIAHVVFTTGFPNSNSGSGGESDGAAARNVSLAGFQLIMLMNALTSTLDVSRQLGDVAGHATRICDLLRAMRAVAKAPQAGLLSPGDPGERAPSHSPSTLPYRWWHRLRRGRGWGGVDAAVQPLLPLSDAGQNDAERSDGRASAEPVTNAFGRVLPKTYRSQAHTLLPPLTVSLHSGLTMEISVHSLGTADLRRVVSNVFPDAPTEAPLLCVCTYQPVRPSASGALLRLWPSRVSYQLLAQSVTCVSCVRTCVLVLLWRSHAASRAAQHRHLCRLCCRELQRWTGCCKRSKPGSPPCGATCLRTASGRTRWTLGAAARCMASKASNTQRRSLPKSS